MVVLERRNLGELAAGAPPSQKLRRIAGNWEGGESGSKTELEVLLLHLNGGDFAGEKV